MRWLRMRLWCQPAPSSGYAHERKSFWLITIISTPNRGQQMGGSETNSHGQTHQSRNPNLVGAKYLRHFYYPICNRNPSNYLNRYIPIFILIHVYSKTCLYQHPKLLSHFELSYHYLFSVLLVCHQFCDKDIHIYTIFRLTYNKYQHLTTIPKQQAYSSKSDLEEFGSHPKIPKFKMTEQHLVTAYTSALAKVTSVIREQVRLIEESNAPAIFNYQRRINREMTDFAETWGVTIRIEVRPIEVKDQPSTLNLASTRRQRQRRINFLPFEAKQSQRFSPTEFYNFIYSLPYVRRDSLGEDAQDNQCSICYYRFFEARGRLEAGAIRNGTAPRPNMNLEPHKVPISDLPELPMCLPCGHVFGHICVQVWILGEESGNPPTCPVCRAIWRPVGWSHVPSGQVTVVVWRVMVIGGK